MASLLQHRVSTLFTVVLLAHVTVEVSSSSHLKYMSFYGMNLTAQKDWLNLAIAEGDLANQFMDVGIPSLARMPETGIYIRGKNLEPTWEAELEKFVDGILPFVVNKTIIGVFMGDEICCESAACVDVVLAPLSAKLRHMLGPEAIIYENECSGTFLEHKGSVPPDMTHISFDYYAGYGPATPTGLNGSAEAYKARAIAEKEIYPRLLANQSIMLVPGTFACSNFSYVSLEESDKSVTEKLEAYFEWAKEDPKVAGFNPWHFNHRGTAQHGPPCDMQVGAVELPNALATLAKIGAYIKANGGASL